MPVINITKTRLNDPLLWFMGTNDQPGDYRSSGCAACHGVYANDRDRLHSGPYATRGHAGTTETADPTIARGEQGHPLRHEFTRAVPTSQCMVCHMHQPNQFVNTYYGFNMWDYESDAPAMWPKQQKYPTDREIRAINRRNPEEAAIRGKWSDLSFLKDVSLLNPTLKEIAGLGVTITKLTPEQQRRFLPAGALEQRADRHGGKPGAEPENEPQEMGQQEQRSHEIEVVVRKVESTG